MENLQSLVTGEIQENETSLRNSEVAQSRAQLKVDASALHDIEDFHQAKTEGACNAREDSSTVSVAVAPSREYFFLSIPLKRVHSFHRILFFPTKKGILYNRNQKSCRNRFKEPFVSRSLCWQYHRTDVTKRWVHGITNTNLKKVEGTRF